MSEKKETLRDKVLLVAYVGVRDRGDDYLMHVAEHIHDAFRWYEDVELILIPEENANDIRLECLNPVLLNEEKYAEVEAAVEKYKKAVDNLLNSEQDEKGN